MPKRYKGREPIKLAEEFEWMLVGVRGDHHNFKHPASRFIVTIVHPQKDVPVGRVADRWKQITSSDAISDHAGTNRNGISVQAPDLAVATYGENIEAAKGAAAEAIRSNLEAYREAGKPVPEAQAVSTHLENPEFRDLLFTYVEVVDPQGRIAA